MKITLAGHAGHCFGVKAAIHKAFETARSEKGAIYTLGPIIHNPQVVEKLENEGVYSVKDLSEITKGVIIIRSHGVSPEIIEKAEAQGLTVVDATCPFVKRAHKLAKELVDQGYDLLILGDAVHPEVEGILGTVHGNARIISRADEVEDLPKKSSYGLIAQTTQSLKNLQDVASALLTRTTTLKVVNTICNATTDLQAETRRLADEVDLMVVVGGRNSANTSRLAEISREAGVLTYHIETSEEIQKEWLEQVNHVGVTAGTSTPDWIINDVMERIRFLDQSSQRTGRYDGGNE